MVETLEARRLLTLLLSLNGGVLTVEETANGVSNATVIQLTNDSTQIQVMETGGETLNENTALFDDGWRVNNQDFKSAIGPETGITSIVVDTDDGQDSLKIPSMNLPLTIRPAGGATESIDLGQRDSGVGAQDITQPITFDGTHAGFTGLTIDDGLDSNNVDPTITSTSILNFAPAPINFTPPPLGSSTTPLMLVDFETGTGTSGFVVNQDPNNAAAVSYQFDVNGQGTLGIEHLNASSSITVEPMNGGSENVMLGAFGLISGVQGRVEVFGNTGTASLSVDDSQDTVAHTFAATASGTVLVFKEDDVQIADLAEPATTFTLDTGTAANTVNLVLNISPLVTTVQSGGADTINLFNLIAGSEADLIGGAGVDNVSLRASELRGAVHISNPTGQEAVSIDASNTSSPHVISVADSQVTGISDGSISMANLASLSVTGGSDFDNFSVTPSATVPITVDGGPATGASTDRLAVTTTNVTGTQLSLQSAGTNETGAYSFTNRQPVNFTQFATITPTFGDVSGTVYNEQAAAIVAGATVIVDENNNGTADAGEPTTTTDVSGAFAFQGLPTGTFAILASAPGLQNLSTISATVSAGVLATPLLVPVVPPATAGGPDLVVTVSAIASGKTHLIKPRVKVKVSNVGTSMTSAAALQIVLAASLDMTPDSTDQQLLTAATAPILLKANKSKSFTLTGETAASLSTGNYFILASVDAANAVIESNEGNNVAASTKAVALAPPVVDLTGKFGRLPKTASKAKVLSVALSIRNLGTISAAGTIDVDFFASADTTLDNSDVSLGTGLPVTAHLAAGKSQTAKFKLSISPSLAAGSCYLVAKVNSTSSITESDLSNNDVFSAIPIAIS